MTGRLATGPDGERVVEYHRAFRMDARRVWSWLSEPDRAAQWLGTWRVGPGGQMLVRFMTDDATSPEFAYRVDALDPGRSAAMSMRDAQDHPQWHVRLTIGGADAMVGGTLVTLQQSMTDPVMAPSVGATCEFLLDRLVLAAHGLDPRVLDFDEYFLAQAPGYRAMFPLQRDGFAAYGAQSS